MKKLFKAILMGLLPIIVLILFVAFSILLIIGINVFVHNISYSILIIFFIIGWIIGIVEYYRNH